MIGYLGSLQKRAEADYDTQIFRAQAQREAKELREQQEKLDKQQKMQESINKHRQETVRIYVNSLKSKTFFYYR
jgi:regulator of protease activity HflC (stomatin/prohibitin superfamily)